MFYPREHGETEGEMEASVSPAHGFHLYFGTEPEYY